MCPGRLSGGGESQNEAKSRRFGIDRPSRAFYEGVNPKTILNNCPERTGRQVGNFPTLHVRILFRSYEVPFLDCVECDKKADQDDVRHFEAFPKDCHRNPGEGYDVGDMPVHSAESVWRFRFS